MRKRILLLALLLAGAGAHAQDRIYVTTDRQTYLAGDLVFCSLFCVDGNGRQSDFSAVSYLELISGEGTAAEAKVGLFEGRGAGSFRIPPSVPTGNYRLVAYSARSGVSPEGSRTLAVFNTTSTARVPGGVEIVPENGYSVSAPAKGKDGFRVFLPAFSRQGKEENLLIDGLPQGADLSVSLFHEDGLAPTDGKTLEAFLHGVPAVPGKRDGEYEGEVILADVEGLTQAEKTDEGQVTAFLSSAGDPTRVYLGRNDADGKIRFYTGNIYGDRELVCEVVSMSGRSCHINLESPFLHPDVQDLPALVLSEAQRGALTARKASLSADFLPALDTLAEFLPKREDLLLSGTPSVRYHLDDYTRFPTVREICTEFIPELQFVRREGRWRIRMVVQDGTSTRKLLQDNILVLMDGVVLTDHGMLEDFDAMLLEDVDIYRQAVALGGVSYNGVVNFISKKNYVTALHFPENVRVVDFKGVAYPVAYPGARPAGKQDLRQLLYWHPALAVPAGGQVRIPVHMPGYAGRFRAVAEGWTPDGTPVRAECVFEVQ